jgi:signal transduction histidine kinase
VDVTDSINYDASKEKAFLLQTINASVSHELRNPLNSIIAQLLCSKLIITNARAFINNDFQNLSMQNWDQAI